MRHEAAAKRDIGRTAERALIRGGAIAAQHGQVHRLVRLGNGNAVVDYVDDTANRRRPILQGLRTAQHFDSVGQQRIDGRRMVCRRVRYVDRADPIGEHAHPLPLQAAQDGPRSAGTERCGRNARRVGQRIADRGAQRCCQFLTTQDRNTRQHVLAGNLHRPGDDNVTVVMRVINVVRIVVIDGLRPCRRSNRQQRQTNTRSKQKLRIHRNSRTAAGSSARPCPAGS